MNLRNLLKMNKFLLILITNFLIAGCSFMKSSSKASLETGVVQYNYEDKNGTFKVSRQVGLEKKTGRLITKQQLELIGLGKESILEQSIVISNPGSIKSKIEVLRPEEGQYSVWFEGKKYSSTIKINAKNKSFELKTTGPSAKDVTSRQIAFPNNQHIFCFFSQLTECLNFHGFIKKSIKEQAGSVRLNLVWNGYPFFQEAYNDLPIELFSNAKLAYDGKIADDEYRFTLGVANQMIFFVTGENGDFKKMFWIAQGISMVRKDLKEK